MSDDLRKLNEERTEAFKKDQRSENFLEDFNKYLLEKEQDEYRQYPVEHPFIFVLGLPRSGTTLTSQFIAHTFDIGFINNLAARFYLAPLHGIRFSRAVLGDRSKTDYQSTYAQTENLGDIHEFGYFWRFWLQKEALEDVAHHDEQEDFIPWQELKACLSSMQYEFGKGMIFKNIFGSYHMPRFERLLDKVLFVYIERDELDVACSITDARKKYYGKNMDKWWSYAPPEVEQLTDLPYKEQIAGQIHYLKRFYYNEFEKLPDGKVLKLDYRDLCEQPGQTAQRIQQQLREEFDYQLPILNTPPEQFEFRTYDNRDAEKQEFETLLDQFKKENA